MQNLYTVLFKVLRIWDILGFRYDEVAIATTVGVEHYIADSFVYNIQTISLQSFGQNK